MMKEDTAMEQPMERPLVSVIVPAYNAAGTIERCVGSLLRQDMSDIEIVVVNDGSTDDTPAVLSRLEAVDGRVKTVTKPNGGSALARRDGVWAAAAEYICFLDSDDMAEPGFCATLYNAITEHDADLAECAYNVMHGERPEKHEPLASSRVLERDAFMDNVFTKTIVNGTEAVVQWNKIYKRSMILATVDDYGASPLEDYLFNLQYYASVQRYAYVNAALVDYMLTNGSLSRSFDRGTYDKLKQVQSVKGEVMQSLSLNTPPLLHEAALWYCSYVERYLKYNRVMRKDASLFEAICKDNELVRQASYCMDDMPFARLISRGDQRGLYRYFARADRYVLVRNIVKGIVG